MKIGSEGSSRTGLAVPIILLAIGLVLGLQAHLALTHEINWDEFYFLSHIYEHQAGELAWALQSFHVHLFAWLTSVPGGEIRQVEVGRMVMLAFETGTCACIYLLARNFASRSGAALATLAYASAGFVMVHGASFRTDPLAAFLMTASLAILASSALRARHLAAFAALTAVAALITAKVVFYAPAFAGVAVWRILNHPRRSTVTLRLFAAAAGAVLLCGLLYLAHQSTAASVDLKDSETIMRSAANRTVFAGEFFPRWNYFWRGALAMPIASALMVLGAVIVVGDAVGRRSARWGALALLALFSPLLSFLFYRNAYPYYFAFILPPAAVLAGVAADRMKLSRLLVLAVAAGMLASAVVAYATAVRADQKAQEEVVDAVHAMFPAPVAYIDRNSMIASFPKRGFFMSTWGLLDYRLQGRPVIAEALAREPIPLLILNGPSLEEAAGMPLALPAEIRLIDEDRQALRANYIPHWGRVWVAGKTLKVGPAGVDIGVAVPGGYTLEAGSAAVIDGVAVGPGSIVVLERGVHQISAAAEQTVTLRWGQNLYRPRGRPSDQPVYSGF